MSTLIIDDLLWATNRLPKLVKAALKARPHQLIVAGGFIRSCVSREEVNDIDLFVPNADMAAAVALELSEGNRERIHRSENAFTVLGQKYTIQIIKRWTYSTPAEIVPSFDFTIARSALWWDGENWQSLCDERFYPDLAAKRLVYCSPDRNEDAGGSILRVLKFYQRGYTMPLGARLLSGIPVVNFEKREAITNGTWEQQISSVMLGLLREVDSQIDPDHIAHLPTPTEEAK